MYVYFSTLLQPTLTMIQLWHPYVAKIISHSCKDHAHYKISYLLCFLFAVRFLCFLFANSFMYFSFIPSTYFSARSNVAKSFSALRWQSLKPLR